MAKKFHKFRIGVNGTLFLDDKPLKACQALHLTMDVRNPGLAILNLVMLITPPELECEHTQITVEQPKETIIADTIPAFPPEAK